MFHLRAKIIGRSGGRSAGGAAAYRAGSTVAAANVAYRAGDKVADPNSGRVFDYSAKGRIDANGYGVLHKEVLAPADAPAWARDLQSLVNQVEAAEKRCDAQLFREIEVSFPRELGLEDQKALIRAYAERMFVREGMVAAIFIHNERASDGGANPHAHILLTLREIGPAGFGKKVRAWNQSARVRDWREAWAEYANEFLMARGHEPRLDHRSHKSRGLDVEPDTPAPRLEHTPPTVSDTPRGKTLWHPPSVEAFEVVIAADLPRVDPRLVTTGQWADIAAPDIAEQARKRMRERDIGLGD